MMHGFMNINFFIYFFISFLLFFLCMFSVNPPDISSARLEADLLNYLTD